MLWGRGGGISNPTTAGITVLGTTGGHDERVERRGVEAVEGGSAEGERDRKEYLPLARMLDYIVIWVIEYRYDGTLHSHLAPGSGAEPQLQLGLIRKQHRQSCTVPVCKLAFHLMITSSHVTANFRQRCSDPRNPERCNG